jgi:hypothetical protein
MMTEPITTWKETLLEGEDAMLTKLSRDLAAIQAARTAHSGGAAERALHVKAHGGLRARLEVHPDLPAPYAQGLFAKADRYDAYVRLSNGTARSQHDKEPDLRGFALKVLGVKGDKALFPHETQDFLLIDENQLPFRTPHEFLSFLQCAQNQLTLPFTLFGKLGFRAFGLITALASGIKGNRGSVLDLEYHSVAPHTWGPYAARLHLVPKHAASPHAKAHRERDYLRHELAPRVAAGGIAYGVFAQLHIDPSESIEDVTRPWTSPRKEVGKLTIVADDPASASGKELDAFVSTLSFDPWHSLATHRPLGLTMRARKPAYLASTKARTAAPEPDGTEWSRFGAVPV